MYIIRKPLILPSEFAENMALKKLRQIANHTARAGII